MYEKKKNKKKPGYVELDCSIRQINASMRTAEAALKTTRCHSSSILVGVAG